MRLKLPLILIFSILAVFSILAQPGSEIPQYLLDLRTEVKSLTRDYKQIEANNTKIQEIRRLKLQLERKKEELKKAEIAHKEFSSHTGPSIRFLSEKYQELKEERVGEDLAISELIKFYGDRIYQFDGYAFNDGSWVGVYADEPNVYSDGNENAEPWGIYYYKAKMDNDTLVNKGFIFLLEKFAIDKSDYSLAKSKGRNKIDEYHKVQPESRFVSRLKGRKGKSPDSEQAARDKFTELWSAKRIKIEGILAKEDWGGDEYLVLHDWIILKE